MNRLRMCGAMLSIASLIVGALFLMLPKVGIPAVIALVVGAGALAFVAPFEAMDTAARHRVAWANLAYCIAVIAALALVLLSDAGKRPLLVLAALLACGLVLTGWAFKTRNRRRRVGWTDYYD